MDRFQGITAKIISNGHVLELYDDPDAAEIEDTHARHHYVEAVAGSTFLVKVDLTPQFELNRMKAEHAVKVRVRIDGRRNSLYSQKFTKECLQDTFSQGKPGTAVFTGPTQFCKETGQWMLTDYSFGNLVLKEIPESGLSVKEAQDLGTIQITVQRVKLEKLQVPYFPESTITTINEVPEKALKGRPIETTVRLTNARPTYKPRVKTERSIKIGGKAGEPVVFKIHYRSRRALQMLGCIPRSPSPAIDVSTELHTSMTSSAGSSDEMLRQIQVLTARITDLERDKIKAEAANTDTVIKNERVGVKREREEDDSQKESRQRRRTAVQIEHVDLTGD